MPYFIRTSQHGRRNSSKTFSGRSPALTIRLQHLGISYTETSHLTDAKLVSRRRSWLFARPRSPGTAICGDMEKRLNITFSAVLPSINLRAAEMPQFTSICFRSSRCCFHSHPPFSPSCPAFLPSPQHQPHTYPAMHHNRLSYSTTEPSKALYHRHTT